MAKIRFADQKIYLRVLDTSVVYMDFNIPDGQQFIYFNPIIGSSIYRTVFEYTRSLFQTSKDSKGFVASSLSLQMREWIDGFGVKPIGNIIQILQINNIDSIYYEYGFGPDFSHFQPVLNAQSFQFSFDFYITHGYSHSGSPIPRDFIDSVYFDCFYKSNYDSISANRLHSRYSGQFQRRIDFQIDSSLIANGYSFYYKVTAKDKGVIPKYVLKPDTGYFKLNYGTTGIDSEHTYTVSLSLHQNYPNPFNPSTKISWQSPVGSHQTLKVHDVLGREVATLVNEYRDAGSYEVEFDASQLTSGVYYYQLKVGEFLETRKMIVVK